MSGGTGMKKPPVTATVKIKAPANKGRVNKFSKASKRT